VAYEIEIKAWVEKPEPLRKRLKSTYSFSRKYVKEDTYFRFPGKKETFRLRKQEGENIVTIKKKRREQGIEENLEKEFFVSDGEVFEKFVSEIGCPVYVKKKKTTEAFDADGITVELSLVEKLGWFIEIEKLVHSENRHDKQKAKDEILKILDYLRIPREKIESRYYTEMLTGISE
jgi:adenylate cyclase, class 2